MKSKTNAEVFSAIGVDSEALNFLTNTDGETFQVWVARTRPERQAYEKALRMGYPAQAEQAAARLDQWESKLAFAEACQAVAESFYERALSVCREILKARRERGIEAASASRVWEQREEYLRWRAICEAVLEWCYNGREAVKQTNYYMAPYKRASGGQGSAG